MSSSPKKYIKLKQKRIRLRDKLSGFDKKLLLKTFRLPDGVLENHFIDIDKNSVQIFPLTWNGEVVLVEQFRTGIEDISLELPGGAIDIGETPEEAAKRELLEETGYVGELTFLAKVNYHPYSTGYRHIYLAENCGKVSENSLDQNEYLRVRIVELDHFRNMIKEAKVRGFDSAYLALERLGMICGK